MHTNRVPPMQTTKKDMALKFGTKLSIGICGYVQRSLDVISLTQLASQSPFQRSEGCKDMSELVAVHYLFARLGQ